LFNTSRYCNFKNLKRKHNESFINYKKSNILCAFLHHYCRGGILTSCEKEQMASIEANNKQAIDEAKYFFENQLKLGQKKEGYEQSLNHSKRHELKKP
jgi:xylose isomerase